MRGKNEMPISIRPGLNRISGTENGVGRNVASGRGMHLRRVARYAPGGQRADGHGLTKSSFTGDSDAVSPAIETIITAAKGIPRIINTVALKAMNDAASNKMTIVDQEGVIRVLGEFGLN
jgi:hypothetical protein